MHIRRHMARFLLALMLLTGLYTQALADKQAVVTAKTLSVHEKPKASSRVLGTLSKGASVTVVKTSGALARIRYAGGVGYVRRSGLKLDKAAKASKDKDAAKQKETPAPAQKTAAIRKLKTAARAIAYKKPLTTSKLRTTVRKGTAFEILGEDGAFYRVRRGKQEAYILKTAFVSAAASPAPTPTPTPAASAERMTVTARQVVYKKASRTARKLGAVEIGDTAEVLVKGKTFYRIRFEGNVAYVSRKAFDAVPAKALTPTPSPRPASDTIPAPQRSVNSSKAEPVIKAALSQLGKRYVYGTSGPDTFDCSGLTYYAYKQAGLSLAHSAQSVGYGAGAKVDRAHLQRGDIVCFNTISDGDQSDHVGIYLGGNQFVHASSGQGRVVVNTLSGYYSDNFSWGRRVL